MKIVCGHSQPHQIRPTTTVDIIRVTSGREGDEHHDVEVLRPEHDAEQHEVALQHIEAHEGLAADA